MSRKEPGTEELLFVIKDFLEMGHVDNIVAMFYRYPDYYALTGAILDDERFNVRLGVSVLFEELKRRQAEQLPDAIEPLLPLLSSDRPHIRGEAVSILGIIGSEKALGYVRQALADEHPQVREVAADILEENGKNLQRRS